VGILKHRYIDPSTSLSEVLFGLIMTLTFTLARGSSLRRKAGRGRVSC
jgi:hypothetical protein